jgi:hypothetical protein
MRTLDYSWRLPCSLKTCMLNLHFDAYFVKNILCQIKDLYTSRKDMNLARFNIDCMQVCWVARTSEITDGSASIFGMMREERSLKFKFESWPPIIGGILKVKRANRLMSIIDEIWVIHLQKVDTLLMIGFWKFTFRCIFCQEHIVSDKGFVY